MDFEDKQVARNIELRRVWGLGVIAGDTGKDRSDNPYEPGTLAYVAWTRGFLASQGIDFPQTVPVPASYYQEGATALVIGKATKEVRVTHINCPKCGAKLIYDEYENLLCRARYMGQYCGYVAVGRRG